MSAKAITGGCQCGAVRYRVEGALTNAHICHCRMCQKAAGNYFMPLAKAMNDSFSVTRGEIAWYRSSDPVRRGFCRDCGTPLIFEIVGSTGPNVTLGSLDDPAAIKPAEQCAPHAKMPWFGELDTLVPEADSSAWYAEIAPSARQHPDHDTPEWPPEKTT